MKKLKDQDPEIAQLIDAEARRQESTINLIASENYPSHAVREALASVFSAKYSEGRPGKRYYAGTECVDRLEELVEERTRALFGLGSNWSVNAQGYSGSPANYAILRGLLERGDRILSMDLGHGGHLTHGSPVSLSGKDFEVSHYGVSRESGLLDYDMLRKRAEEVRPKLIIAGHSAYPRTIDFESFRTIAEEVGALLFADISHIAGLIAGGMHPSPFPHADVVMTTTHKSLRGPRGALIICKEELRERIFPMVFPGLQGGPHNHTIAGIGVALKEALSKDFKRYASDVVGNARTLARTLTKLGQTLATGGTDNHLMLIDLSGKDMLGKEAQEILERAGIVANKNVIPFDAHTPGNPSGIRLGTPAVTTRGMEKKDMEQIGRWINALITRTESPDTLSRTVAAFAQPFPIP